MTLDAAHLKHSLCRRVLFVVSILLLIGNPLAQIFDSKGRFYDGQWSDACPCTGVCPCWHTGQANARVCTNVQLYRFRHGPPGLSGKSVVLVGNPLTDYSAPYSYDLYVPRETGNLGMRSARLLFHDQLGYTIGRITLVTLSSNITTGTHEASIPGVLVYNVQDQGLTLSPDVRDYLYPWLHSGQQWTSKRVLYTDSSLEDASIGYSATNALFADFSIPHLAHAHSRPPK